MPRRQRVGIAIVAAVAVAGCGGRVAEVAETVRADPRPAAYAEAYGGDPDPVELSDDEAAILARLGAEGPLGCAVDPRLVRAARRHAAALASAGRAPSEAEMDHLRFAVLAEGGTDYLLTPFAVRDVESGQPALTAFVDEHRSAVTHCGVGTARAGDRVVAVWVGSKRAFDIDSVPVMHEVGAALTVRGRALGEGGVVRAFLGLPDGSAIALRAEANNGAFAVTVPLERAGRHDLEVQIDLGGGPETASLLPLYAGTPPDARPTVAAADADAGQLANETPDVQLFSLVNAARKRLGIATLARDARLDGVALAHSNDMVALGYFGHRSPGGAMLADRLRATGLRPVAFGENVARSSGAMRVHRNLMSSPSHRIELLNRSYTHMGVGVARDGDDLVVTEVLVRW